MKFVTVGPLIKDRLVKFVQSKDLLILLVNLTFDPPFLLTTQRSFHSPQH